MLQSPLCQASQGPSAGEASGWETGLASGAQPPPQQTARHHCLQAAQRPEAAWGFLHRAWALSGGQEAAFQKAACCCRGAAQRAVQVCGLGMAWALMRWHCVLQRTCQHGQAA